MFYVLVAIASHFTSISGERPIGRASCGVARLRRVLIEKN